MTSKLHLPGPGGKPLCGRQLQNQRQLRAQISTDRQFATDGAEYLKALLNGKACRHCGYRHGLLVRTRTVRELDGEYFPDDTYDAELAEVE